MSMLKIGEDEYNGKISDVVLICGKITKDGEVKNYNGKDIGKSSIVGKKNSDGTTMFIGLSGWGTNANAIGRLKKGNTCLVVGRLNKNEYNEKTYWDCTVDYISTSAVSIFGTSELKPAKVKEVEEEDGQLPF